MVQTWTTQGVDVRHDPTIAAQVTSFLREGSDLSSLPLWAHIDRFTPNR